LRQEIPVKNNKMIPSCNTILNLINFHSPMLFTSTSKTMIVKPNIK